MEHANTIRIKGIIHGQAVSAMGKNVHTVSFIFIHNGEEYELMGDCEVKDVSPLFGNSKIYSVNIAGNDILFKEDKQNTYLETQTVSKDFWNNLVKKHNFERVNNE